jgi:hypothetical protein
MTTRPRRRTFVDPRTILEEIAQDRTASSTARVSACRALLALRTAEEEGDVAEALTRRALEMGARHDV